ncbi:aldo/keto reductase [Lentzea sp. NPDC004789]
MPRLGLGTWRLHGHSLRSILDQAFDEGYRLVDTASYYKNESTVGQAIRLSGLPRESIFVTTKIRGADQGRQRAIAGYESSLRRLGLDYVDLLLIHWPLPSRDLYIETWESLIELRERNMVRAIGVSNFNPHHTGRIVDTTGVTPAVNQVQCNPFVQNRAMRTYNDTLKIHTQAWEPLGPTSNVLTSGPIKAVASHLGRTPAQVVLRWHIQVGNSIVPKTSTPSRLRENLDVFDWKLPADMQRLLDSLDDSRASRADPDIHIVD